MSRFDGRVAFITGGAMGFGLAFGEALGREGAAVVLADRNGVAVTQAAAELSAAGLNAVAVECDVVDKDEVDRAVAEAVDLFGGIDILINNAGLHLTKYNQPFSQLPLSDIRALFDVNMMGVINCSLASLEPMRARGGGSIVNISSMASYSSTSPYGVSKLAVRGLTIAFATEFAGSGIRCNAIAPGLIATESAMADLPEGLVDSIVNDRQLVNRLGEVADIASMAVYLCSDEASFITGETFKVSGGMPLWI